jgi:hypothetical protein
MEVTVPLWEHRVEDREKGQENERDETWGHQVDDKRGGWDRHSTAGRRFYV